jgi:hypothetical protein
MTAALRCGKIMLTVCLYTPRIIFLARPAFNPFFHNEYLVGEIINF